MENLAFLPIKSVRFYFFVFVTVVLLLVPSSQILGSPSNYPPQPYLTDTDGDGVPDHVDIDDDNDGILDTVECEIEDFYSIQPSDLGCGNNESNFTVSNFDVSSQFGLAMGSILISVTNASASSSGQFTIKNDQPTTFLITGTVPVLIKAAHSRGLNNGGSDGIFALDNIRYQLISNLPTGITENNVGNQYTVNSSLGSGSEDFVWKSDFFATKIEFFTTNTARNNFIYLNIAPAICPDTDGDGIPDFKDIDSDNDGILDNVEAQVNSDYTAPCGVDSDGNGLDDHYEEHPGSGEGLTPINSDTDSYPDYLDIDSDNDGIPDNVEGQSTVGYVPPSGSDSDNDGLDDTYEGSGDEGITPEDTDGDTVPDYLDGDSDDDLVPDNNEGNDFDFDGQPDQALTGTDTDGDGLDDGYEGSDVDDGFDVNDEIDDPANDLPDTDGTEDVNYRDLDDDGDGIDTPKEDANEDGDPTNDDTDGDGTPDYLDPDIVVEVNQLVTPNGDGKNDFLFIEGLEIVNSSKLQIFNRWGVKVYDGTNYNNVNNVFDGRSRGRSTLSVEDYLPSGIYFYIFDYVTDFGSFTDSQYLYISR